MVQGNAGPHCRRPPMLRPGARVGLVAPAGPVTEERISAALAHCTLLEVEPVLGHAVRERTAYLAGSDAARLADLMRMMHDPSIDAVWALRGGYGTMRLLRAFEPPAAPRLYLGFSDNTAIHLRLLAHGHVSFHGPHPGADLPPVALECLRRVLFDNSPAGVLPAGERSPTPLVGGLAEGELVGGNLSLLAALCGTPWPLHARGRIVFFEEIGEPAYRVDRLLRQLELAGALEGAAGLALGQFTECGDAAEAALVESVVREFAQSLGVPAVLGLPIGHVAENWTLPLGVRARLDADAGTLSLLEPAVEAP